MRILLIGGARTLDSLAEILRTEGARVRAREPGAFFAELHRETRGVDAVVIDDIATAATLLELLRNDAPSVLRVLMVGDGGIRERSGDRLYQLLFPREWTRAEARVLCAWVRSNRRRRGVRVQPD